MGLLTCSHQKDEDNLVRSRSAEALMMKERNHTTHRLTVIELECIVRLTSLACLLSGGSCQDDLGKPQTSPTLKRNEASEPVS